MAVTFTNHESNFNLRNKKKVKDWIKKITKENKKEIGSISYIFTSENYILEINKQYLGHNYFTDIITFDYSNKNIIEGDIFISIDTVLTNSAKFHTEFDEEILRVIIHGIFHLLGYKDRSEKQKQEMRSLENSALYIYKGLNG